MIKIDDFLKLDLRVAKILNAERIEESDKLIKIQIDIGSEKRTIVAGIGNKYKPEELIGQLIVVVSNLEPKMIKGVKSEGMLLAVNSKNGPVLVVPLEQVLAGERVS
ncbi:MAG: methionine--tRNA ligase subunit beta [Patescibacteria group bacterium]|nr:methionine--tRNA ligase subunit beta [Patescibacteria group bacterium]